MIRTRPDAASRLLSLEAEDKRLCARMQKDRVRRTFIQEEISRLRIGMSDREAARYRDMKFKLERV